jgi:hypothetical protein
MTRKSTVFAAAALLAGALTTSSAWAKVLIVDDDNLDPFQCSQPQFHTIATALAQATPGDEIRICPGTYPEQLVLTEAVQLTGISFGTAQPIIKPTALPATRPSLLGNNPVAAGIIVDGNPFKITNLVIDLSGVNVSACVPSVAGIYVRAAAGFILQTTVENVRVTGNPACNSGVGLYVESGQTGEVLGIPTISPARVSVRDADFLGYQKAGLVANGPRTIVQVKGGSAVGGGATAGAVQYGYQAGYEAKVKITQVTTSDHQSLIAGKAAAGILVFDGTRVSVRKATMSDSQEGVLGVADRLRVKKSSFSDMTGDGIVFLGDGNLASSNLIERSSVSGVFIKGEVNVVRGGVIRNQSVGIWFQTGSLNHEGGVQFTNVPLATQVISAGVRWDMTEASAVPFTTACTTNADCDDGNSCTTAVCDTTTGHCNFTTLAAGSACDDGNSCTTDVCTAAGVCQGTALPAGTACDDKNSCTTGDVCNATGTCVGTQAPAGTACNDGNACTGPDACNAAGVCVGAPSVAGTVCDDGNACTTNDACNGNGACIGVIAPTGTACVSSQPCTTGFCSAGSCLGTNQPPGTACDDGNACTTNDVCAAGAVCAGTPAASGTACDDGNACTGPDVCNGAGACSGPAVVDGTTCGAAMTCTAGVCS